MQALGLIEVIGYVTAIEGADAALKAASINLLGITKVGGGIVTIKLMGDVSAVSSAVSAGGEAAKKIGVLRRTHVIASTDESVVNFIVKPKENEKPEPKENDLSHKTNAELKEMVNQLAIPFEKPIKYAKKDELVAAIENHFTGNTGEEG